MVEYLPGSRPSAPRGWTLLDPTQMQSTYKASEQPLVKSELVNGVFMILLETCNLIILKANLLQNLRGKLSLWDKMWVKPKYGKGGEKN